MNIDPKNCAGMKADSEGVKRELLAIAEEMRDVAARRAANDPHADTQLTSWAGRIQRALLNGETMETAMQAAQAKAARRAGYAEAQSDTGLGTNPARTARTLKGKPPW